MNRIERDPILQMTQLVVQTIDCLTPTTLNEVATPAIGYPGFPQSMLLLFTAK